MAETTTPILDLDVFSPAPTKEVKIAGTKYGVLDPLDLRYDDYLALLSLEQRLEGKSEIDQLGLVRDQIYRMIPGLPAGSLEQLPLRQIAWLLEFIQRTVRESRESGDAPLG